MDPCRTSPRHSRTFRGPALTTEKRPGLILQTALLPLLSALLSGCAVMSVEECQYADWHSLGIKDGSEGRPLSYVQQRIEACAEAGISTDPDRYAQGREQGLKHYCRPENAFSLGAQGKTYAGVCPAAVDAEFRQRLAAGRAIHDAQKEVKRIEDRIESKERELRHTHQDEETRLRGLKQEDDRRRIQREFKLRRDRLRAEIDELDRALRRARDRLFAAERADFYRR